VTSASAKAFVATGSHLVQFLDTVSVARFTATSKECRPLLDLEVARRKAKIHEYEERVKQLIGCEGEEPEFYVRANVEAAIKLCQAARDLSSVGPFFRDERAKFLPPRVGSLDAGEHPRSPLLMLPTILYLPETGEPVHPGRDALDRMEHFAYSLWGAEDHGFDDMFFLEVRPHVHAPPSSCRNKRNHFRRSESHHTFSFLHNTRPCIMLLPNWHPIRCSWKAFVLLRARLSGARSMPCDA
jgi:hypothetical protein